MFTVKDDSCSSYISLKSTEDYAYTDVKGFSSYACTKTGFFVIVILISGKIICQLL